ncbi:MAG: GAF domain-containing protein [Thermovirgaceae bacterium]
MAKNLAWAGAFGLLLLGTVFFGGSFELKSVLFAGSVTILSSVTALKASRSGIAVYVALFFLAALLYSPFFQNMPALFAAFVAANGGLALFVRFAGRRIAKEHLWVLEYVRELGRAQTPDEACGLATEFIGRLERYDLAAAMLYEPGRDRLVLRGHSGIPTAMASLQRGKGVCWRVYLSGEHESIDDVKKDPDYIAGIPGMRSELCVPIEWEGMVHGVLNIESRRVGKFSSEEIRLVELLAGILGQVLGHMLANEDLDTRYREQQDLAGMQRRVLGLFHGMSTASTQDELFHAVIETVHEKFRLGEVSIHVRESEGHPFRPVASTRPLNPNLLESLKEKNQGIIGHIIETGEPYLTNDADADPHFHDDDPRVLSEIIVPVAFGERLMGFIVADAFRRNAFSQSDLELLDLIGLHMAAELENKQILRQLDEGYERMRLLHEVTREAAAASDLKSMAQRVVRSLAESMRYKAMAVSVPQGELSGSGLPRMKFLASNLHAEDELEGLSNYLAEKGGGLVARVAAKGEIYHVPDVGRTRDYVPFLESMLSELHVPIFQGGRVMGVLSVGDEKPFSRQDEEVYRLLSAHLAAIWRTHELIDRLETQALVDELTGLWNRRYIFTRIKEESERLARYGGTFSVAMIDLTDFKAINDRLGHAMGDTVLRGVGAFLVEFSRDCDIVARYGGDEFLLLMPAAGRNEAETVLSRLREDIRSAFLQGVPSSVFVGLDYGVASFPEDGAGLKAVMETADQRLYVCKAERQTAST